MACIGITYQVLLFRLDVGYPAYIVPYAFCRWIEIQGVDREVAAYGIFSLVAENVVGQEPSVLVRGIVSGLPAAECRHLDGFRPGENVHQPKAPADDKSATEQRFDLFGRRVGGDVEI